MAEKKSNIVLIGMPGSGKSTMGVLLAKQINYNFLDADLLIQSQCDHTLQKILEAMGPDGFIQVENQVLCDIDCERTVIATGGSAIYSEEGMQHLADNGIIVYLKTSLDELESRVGGLHERGVVMKEGIGMNLASIYEERLPIYEHYAQITVETDGHNLREASEHLIDILTQQGAI